MSKWSVIGLVLGALGVPAGYIAYTKYLGQGVEETDKAAKRLQQSRCDAAALAVAAVDLPDNCEQN